MQKFLDLIKEERVRQDKLYGEQNHALERWVAILGEEFGEVCKEVCEIGYAQNSEYKKGLEAFHRQQLKDELIQVAAVCVAILEAMDRQLVESVLEEHRAVLQDLATLEAREQASQQQQDQQQLQLPLQLDETGSEET